MEETTSNKVEMNVERIIRMIQWLGHIVTIVGIICVLTDILMGGDWVLGVMGLIPSWKEGVMFIVVGVLIEVLAMVKLRRKRESREEEFRW